MFLSHIGNSTVAMLDDFFKEILGVYENEIDVQPSVMSHYKGSLEKV